MTSKEAIEVLGISPSADAEEIQRRFQELYSDLQLRLANAPTPRLRETYQKNLQEIQTAFAVLSPAGEYTEIKDLPSVEPSLSLKQLVTPLQGQQSAELSPMRNKIETPRRWPKLLVAVGLLVITIVVIAYISWHSQQVITFEKTLSLSSDGVYPVAVQQTQDGGYVIFGDKAWSENLGETIDSNIVFLLKVDSYCNIQWEKTYTGYSACQAVQMVGDGGYIITSYGLGTDNLYLFKIDSHGNIQWQKTFGKKIRDHSEYSPQVVETISESSYTVAGNFYEGLGADYRKYDVDMYLLRIDSHDKIQWRKTYDDLGHSYVDALQLTPDGGFLMFGSINHLNDDGRHYIYLLKTDSLGLKQWKNIYGYGNETRINDFQQTSDGGYIIAGNVTFDNVGIGTVIYVYLLKIDPQGKFQWQQTYRGRGYGEGNSILIASDNGFIVVGSTSKDIYDDGNVPGLGLRDLYLIKTDSYGVTQWEKIYGDSEYDGGVDVQQTSDGGYIIVGSKQLASNKTGLYLIKTDANGNVLK